MESKSSYIPQDQLEIIQKLILDKDYESCGILLEKFDHKLKLFIDNYGLSYSPTHRASCMLKRYSRYIWHTHPHTSKAYPSWEDIITVIKHHNINDKNSNTKFWPEVSLIFTFWGIWDVRCKNKTKMTEKYQKYIEQVHNYCVKKLYKETKGRQAIDSTDLPDEFSNCINRKLESFSPFFQLKFTPWKDIKNDYMI
jgi:hypothetical protein